MIVAGKICGHQVNLASIEGIRHEYKTEGTRGKMIGNTVWLGYPTSYAPSGTTGVFKHCVAARAAAAAPARREAHGDAAYRAYG